MYTDTPTAGQQCKHCQVASVSINCHPAWWEVCINLVRIPKDASIQLTQLCFCMTIFAILAHKYHKADLKLATNTSRFHNRYWLVVNNFTLHRFHDIWVNGLPTCTAYWQPRKAMWSAMILQLLVFTHFHSILILHHYDFNSIFTFSCIPYTQWTAYCRQLIPQLGEQKLSPSHYWIFNFRFRLEWSHISGCNGLSSSGWQQHVSFFAQPRREELA
jgi:hypothetical protein